MFLNIVTPCTRPQNLYTIAESINIPREQYRWIVVFDANELPLGRLIPPTCETYYCKDPGSIVGNSQRNLALDLVKDGHIYFNDDDTVLHENLWDNIKELSSDFISFRQEDTNSNIRLEGKEIKLQKIDSHNFIVSKNLAGDTRWNKKVYAADGIFATELYEKAVRENYSISYLPKVLSTYNKLR